MEFLAARQPGPGEDPNAGWFSVEYPNHAVSDPWQVTSDGSWNSGSIVDDNYAKVYFEDVTDSYGNASNLVEGYIDASLLKIAPGYESFTGFSNVMANWTMQCGNDFLNATASAVPEPTTLLLLGSGMIGLAGARRKGVRRD